MKFGPDHQGRHGVLVQKGDIAGVLGWWLALASTANAGGELVPRQGVGAAGTGVAIMWQVRQATRAEIQPEGSRGPAEDAGRRQQPCHGLVQEPPPLNGGAPGAWVRQIGDWHGLEPIWLVGLGFDQAATSEGPGGQAC